MTWGEPTRALEGDSGVEQRASGGFDLKILKQTRTKHFTWTLVLLASSCLEYLVLQMNAIACYRILPQASTAKTEHQVNSSLDLWFISTT